MSEVARWSYTNKATVTPFMSEDRQSGEITYGDPYEIACTWIAERKEFKGAAGSGGVGRTAEYVSTFVFFCEDPRPKYRDLIARNGVAEAREILDVLEWDMSMFDGGIPDYKVIT